jgi:hypothetical protein
MSNSTPIPSVSVTYAQDHRSTRASALGMRPMQERAYIGRRFKNDTERLEKLFELYTKITEAPAAGDFRQRHGERFTRAFAPATFK